MSGRIVRINDVEPGMVLARDVKTGKGRLLVAAGNEVLERHKTIFKQWQISDVCIVDGIAEVRRKAPVPRDILLKAHKVNRVRFCQCDLSKGRDDNRATRSVYRKSTLRLADLIIRKEMNKIVPNLKDLKTIDPKKINISPPPSKRLIDSDVKLSTIPDIFAQIIDAVNAPNTSAVDIAAIVKRDVALCAKLLRIVNSPFFAMQTKIDTISRAVAVVGTRQLGQLALGLSVVEMFNSIPKGVGIDMYRFWQHSLAVGIASRILATQAKMPRSAERLFICGLLHDLGRIVMYTYAPNEMLYCLYLATKGRKSLRTVESGVFGYNHCHVAGQLFKKWKLPEAAEMCARWHDTPEKSKYMKEVCIVHIANSFANSMGYGTSGEVFIPPVDEKAWEVLGIGEGALDTLAETLDYQMEDITRMLIGNG